MYIPFLHNVNAFLPRSILDLILQERRHILQARASICIYTKSPILIHKCKYMRIYFVYNELDIYCCGFTINMRCKWVFGILRFVGSQYLIVI